MSSTAERRHLRWKAGTPLPDAPPPGTVFALDAYDWWHFRRLGAHEPELQARLAEAPSLLPLAADLYAALFKPSPIRRRGASNPLTESILGFLERKGDLAALRTRTVLNEWCTVTALPALVAPLAAAFHEARSSPAARETLRAGRSDHGTPPRNARRAGDGTRAGPPPGRGTSAGGPAGRQGGDGSAPGSSQRHGSGPAGDATAPAGDDGSATVGDALGSLPAAQSMFLARGAGARVVHDALDAYEEARARLAEYDARWRLDQVPDQRGPNVRPTRRRFQKRLMPPEPPHALKMGRPPPARAALVDEMARRAQRFEALKREVEGRVQDAFQQIARGQDPSVARACASAARAVENALEVIRSVQELFHESDAWGREMGAGQRLPIDELVRLGRLLRENRSIRDLVELAGRWSLTMKRRFPRAKSPHGRSEVFEIELGGDVDRLVPSELTQLRHPLLRRAVLARALERRALVRRMQGPHLLGRGPVLVVVDTSGSMEGERIVLAKGICLAIALRCWEKRRPFAVLTFGAPGELRVTEFRPSDDFLSRLYGCIGLVFGGGTDFDAPLLRVCELVSSKRWSQADALFLTDGWCDVKDGTLEILQRTKKERDLQILGVLLADGSGLEKVADSTFTLDPRAVLATPSSDRLDPLLRRLSGRI